MKKLVITLATLMAFSGVSAQTILKEDFETGNTEKFGLPVTVSNDWKVVSSYTGAIQQFNWHNTYRTGEAKVFPSTNSARVESPVFSGDREDVGPREEVLLSPELNLNDTYQLKFSFYVSGNMVYADDSRYDLQVRVVEGDDIEGGETIFSLHNEKMLRESGIVGYPLYGWDPHTAAVDLSDFKGEKVKLAFVYKTYQPMANVLELDDISVSKFDPPTGPVARLSLTRNDFGTMYVGERVYSELISLTNIGKDGLTIRSVDLPDGMDLVMPDRGKELLAYQSADFRLRYNAGMTTPASGSVVFHTNGGDVSVDFTASKQALPVGTNLETFEGSFPPAGWANNGWSTGFMAIEGDYSATGSGYYGVTTLRTPRLDLNDPSKVTFTFFNHFTSDDPEGAPEYDITLELSDDGGETYKVLWTSDYINELNTILTKTIDLPAAGDNCYLRWSYPAIEVDDEGAAEHSTFIFDRVLLPPLFGQDGVPGAPTLKGPENNKEQVYPKGVVLTWGPAQFADGYKVYVGTTAACNELVDGTDVGKAYSFSLPTLDYETTYRWKIVPYNSKGDCPAVSTWRFTTQKDASVSEYPYEENFNDTFPTGWTTTATEQIGNHEWAKNNYYPYQFDGKTYGVLFSGWQNPGESTELVTPEFLLPSDKTMVLTFLWANQHPSNLKVDPEGLKKKNNADPHNGKSKVSFQILTNGQWEDLTYYSDANSKTETAYWITEKVDLSPYIGQKVQFRWVHESYDHSDGGSAITHVRVVENKDFTAGLNRSSWDAGKVNFNMGKESGDIFTLFNQGTKELVLRNVEFSTPNFTTTLKTGDKIAVDDAMKFGLRFNALESAATVEDKMVLSFDDDFKIELPVKGEALPKGTYYYSFEPNEFEYDWSADFITVDQDNLQNFAFLYTWVGYSKNGNFSAFSLENDREGDGMYGMMVPVSGMHALVAASPQYGKADNWLISHGLKINSESAMSFWVRNMHTQGDVEPAPLHRFEVLVSESSRAITTAYATLVEETEIPLLPHNSPWKEYTVDLSKYAGKEVYVALRHTTDKVTNLAFFDDIAFHNVEYVNGPDVGVCSPVAIGEIVRIEVYNFNGVKMAEASDVNVIETLDKGLYIVKAYDKEGNSNAYRIVR